MPTLAELMKRDEVTAAWFWVNSHSVGPYAEQEEYDVVFTIDTDYVVGGGYHERRTLYVPGRRTTRSLSRRENGGQIIEGNPVELLGELLDDAREMDNYPTFKDWCEHWEDMTSGPAWQQHTDYMRLRAMRDQVHRFLGEFYDDYLKADRD